MDSDQFRKAGKQMIDYVADYLENIQTRSVLPSVKTGYIQKLIPAEAPVNPEEWKDIFNDIEHVIMSGVI